MNTPSNNIHGFAFWAVAVPTGLAIFLLVVITATLVTFILPQSYYSEARLKVAFPGPGGASATAAALTNAVHTEAEVMTSEVVLKPVVEELGLNARWGQRYLGGEPLKTSDTIELLRRRLTVQTVPETSVSILVVGVYDEQPDVAAEVANKVAKVYAGFSEARVNPVRAEMLDKAIPPLRPARPNKPLNISLGALAGAFLGVIGGGLGGWAVVAWNRRRASSVPR